MWIFILAAVQCSILPSIFGSMIYVDIMTSWLAIIFIRQGIAAGAVLAAVAGFILETHSTHPAGLYMCIYGVTLVVITNLKDPLSWTHSTPWLLTVILANIWTVAFELTVLTILNADLPFFEWRLVLIYAARLVVGTLIGLGLAQLELRAKPL